MVLLALTDWDKEYAIFSVIIIQENVYLFVFYQHVDAGWHDRPTKILSELRAVSVAILPGLIISRGYYSLPDLSILLLAPWAGNLKNDKAKITESVMYVVSIYLGQSLQTSDYFGGYPSQLTILQKNG